MVNGCKECGCKCKNCKDENKDNSIVDNQRVENESSDDHFVEIAILQEDLHTWQDKYKRLSEAYKRVQRVNQGLEDKLLKLVDSCETEKNILTKDVAVLSEKLAEANYTIKKLTENNERYKNDVNLAIQFLQCKQSNYVVHKFDSLPPTVQNEVSVYMTGRRKSEEKKPQVEPKSIKVPMPTFPPTAMFYSLPKTTQNYENEPETTSEQIDVVSAAIMAKILEERQRERLYVKHCDTCTCSKNLTLTDTPKSRDVYAQTDRTNCKNCDTNPTKIQNFETENFSNIVKVQPNNFLLEKNNIDSNFTEINENFNIVPQTSNLSFAIKKININSASLKKNIIHVHKTTDIVDTVRKISDTNSELENLLNKETGQQQNLKNDNQESVQFLDKSKYQEMEENVKRFLFKKTELWKEPTNYDQESNIQNDI